MILIDEIALSNEADIVEYLAFFKEDIHTREQELSYEVIETYIYNVFEADQKLQKLVSNISTDLISCVILPVNEEDDFDIFKFRLINSNDEKIRKREELLYHNYCDQCFGNVLGLMSLGEMYQP